MLLFPTIDTTVSNHFRSTARWAIAVLALCSTLEALALSPVFLRTDGDDSVCDGSADNSAASAPTCAFSSLAKAVAEVDPSGEIRVGVGTFEDTAQVVFDKSVTVQGTDQSTTIFTHPTFDTGAAGSARGWWLIDPGTVVHINDLTLDGSGSLTYQAVRHQGSGSFNRVTFKEIRYLESTPGFYQGTAVAAFGDDPTDFDDCVFSGIGRVGILFFGPGINLSTVSDSHYTGKGIGNFVDYAFEVGAGAIVNIVNNTILDNLGVAASDGSKSGGVLATTTFGSGTFATLTGNDISNCTTGILFGNVGPGDTSGGLISANNLHANIEKGIDIGGDASVDITFNCITENAIGVQFDAGATGMVHNNNIVDNTTGARYIGTDSGLDFENNWWARADGPSGDGTGAGDLIDGTSGGGSIDFIPFLGTPEPNTPTCNVLPVALQSFTID